MNIPMQQEPFASVLHLQFSRPLVVKMIVNILQVKLLVDCLLLHEAGKLLPVVVEGPHHQVIT